MRTTTRRRALHSMGAYNGIPIVPALLAPALRSVLQQRGISGSAVSDNGEIDPQALLALGYDTMQIRTALTPPITVNLKDVSSDSGPGVLEQVQPEVIFSGPAGTYRIAPRGSPTSTDDSIYYAGGGLVAGLVGLWLIGSLLFS